jgi:cytochrome P450
MSSTKTRIPTAGYAITRRCTGSDDEPGTLLVSVPLFARHPGEYAKILADPARTPNAVEEGLRHSSPAQYQGRTVTCDVEWYGPKDARVLLLNASANRDEREFPEPDRFDIERQPPLAVGFGYGIHFCIGASLARLESRVALEEFTRRLPRHQIDEAHCEHVHMSNVHGYESVPFTAGS